jgi:ribosomal protein S18 acetylase RimI-like enzyme
MPAAYTIREARTQDLDALVELLGMLFSIESDFAVDPERQRMGLMLMLGKGPRVVLVAASSDDEASNGKGGRVVGMATAQLLISTAEGGPALLVEDIVVRPEARGKGIGKALLARIEAWGLRLGATRLQLLADRHNTGSHSFYEACGFASTNLVCLRRVLPAAGK